MLGSHAGRLHKWRSEGTSLHTGDSILTSAQMLIVTYMHHPIWPSSQPHKTGSSYTCSSILQKNESLRLKEKEDSLPLRPLLSSLYEALGWTFPWLGKCLASRSTSAHPTFQLILGRLCWRNSMAGICEGAWKACLPGNGFSCDVAAMHGTQLFIVLNFIFRAVGFLSHLLNSQIRSLLDH